MHHPLFKFWSRVVYGLQFWDFVFSNFQVDRFLKIFLPLLVGADVYILSMCNLKFNYSSIAMPNVSTVDSGGISLDTAFKLLAASFHFYLSEKIKIFVNYYHLWYQPIQSRYEIKMIRSRLNNIVSNTPDKMSLKAALLFHIQIQANMHCVFMKTMADKLKRSLPKDFCNSINFFPTM